MAKKSTKKNRKWFWLGVGLALALLTIGSSGYMLLAWNSYSKFVAGYSAGSATCQIQSLWTPETVNLEDITAGYRDSPP